MFTNHRYLPDEKEVAPKKEEQITSSSIFQRQRVDMLLMELGKKFPIPQIPFPEQKAEEDKASNKNDTNKEPTIKQEPVDPANPTPIQNSSGPPEKKIKINN
jgi:mediator of RNA polymerase II transcription subunit 6